MVAVMVVLIMLIVTLVMLVFPVLVMVVVMMVFMVIVMGAWESCPGFADYINSGAPGDVFDGFALKYRVCEPISGSGVAIAVASDIGKVWAHLGPWIKDFGIQFEVTAVVSDAEFAAMW